MTTRDVTATTPLFDAAACSHSHHFVRHSAVFLYYTNIRPPKMVIHTVGDSHSYFGWDFDGVTPHHVGPRLCYSIGRDGINLSSYSIKEHDTVIFSFGEIDCRCHVHKYITAETDFRAVIDPIVERYIEKIKAATSSLTNVQVGIYNVVPPVQKHTSQENPHFPFLGTDQDRLAYTRYFNSRLAECCAANGFLFVDIFDKYSDADGFLNHAFSDGIVHIKNNCFLREFLMTHGILPSLGES